MKPWWHTKEAYENFLYDLSSYPELISTKEENRIVILGPWRVLAEDTIIAEYKVRIEIPDNFPEEVPKVFETEEKLLKEPDDHFNYDKSACLFVQPARWEKWPVGSGIKSFLDGAVKEFFFSQAYRAKNGKWPFGEYLHGNEGIAQFFLEKLNLKDINQLKKVALARKSPWYYNKKQCPCGKNQKFYNCHKSELDKLKWIPEQEWKYLENLLSKK